VKHTRRESGAAAIAAGVGVTLPAPPEPLATKKVRGEWMEVTFYDWTDRTTLVVDHGVMRVRRSLKG